MSDGESQKIITQMAENAKNHLPHFKNAAFDIVAIAASAGGLTALIKVLSTLPPEFTAAIANIDRICSMKWN
ncbi:CheB methylesterase [Nostoc commune NIES-4072]|uniref:CheB methylesterase n=1 Tax=Nostoc commune NIES-4072 TaxID=2005467 RepID=A0A2R5FQ52_NOSCO|nr:hypothetical protein [Nostoc commune]BBD69382.1 CheB methylesterase [Nostoc commune HK-02]GBG19618.1 CheB methylesterase [Nostoc commune NIES-4072]